MPENSLYLNIFLHFFSPFQSQFSSALLCFLPFFLLEYIAVIPEQVPQFALGNVPELNCLYGTILNTGHTVRAVIFCPLRFFIDHLNDVHRTETRTLAAADARILYIVRQCGLPETAPERIERKSDQDLEQPDVSGFQHASVPDRRGDLRKLFRGRYATA